MKFLYSLVLALSLPLAASNAEDAANLLTNPNFETWAGGKPDGWAVSAGQTVTPLTDANVEGVKTGIKVEVVADGGETLGEIRQSVKGFSGGRFRFEGLFQSTKPGLAVFMIKLRKDKTELKRLSVKEKSGSDWSPATLEFDAEGATEIQILCRYQQTSAFVGGTGAFTKLKLEPIN
jgi:hypothetical protein